MDRMMQVHIEIQNAARGPVSWGRWDKWSGPVWGKNSGYNNTGILVEYLLARNRIFKMILKLLQNSSPDPISFTRGTFVRFPEPMPESFALPP